MMTPLQRAVLEACYSPQYIALFDEIERIHSAITDVRKEIDRDQVILLEFRRKIDDLTKKIDGHNDTHAHYETGGR